MMSPCLGRGRIRGRVQCGADALTVLGVCYRLLVQHPVRVSALPGASGGVLRKLCTCVLVPGAVSVQGSVCAGLCVCRVVYVQGCV